ncbi:MAG: energy-coupling factor transporter transmembrane component T [Acutalibacteraceae bacterium]|nr:energy-coupling factor transporter transmembrane component T [Acutalibacteraceae bacterium]
MTDPFSRYHPFVNLIYFALVIGFSMVVDHPLAQIISLASSVTYVVSTQSKKSVAFLLKFCLPLVLLTAFINPVFNHEGKTILLYLSNGNPLTLESILYGFSSGCMIVTLFLWFSAFSVVMTSDKFIYLFGKVIPSLSLVLSMTLRFVPKFKKQMKNVADAQRCIGRDVSNGSLLNRTKTAITIISIMITWSLENAIETADSMKSRGYGLKGRTTFSIYCFEDRDKYTLVWFLFCFLYLLAGVIVSVFDFRYFPDIQYSTFDIMTISFYVMYLGLCITPVVLNTVEDIKWKTIYSKM